MERNNEIKRRQNEKKGKRRFDYHQKITNYEPKHNITTFCPTGTKII